MKRIAPRILLAALIAAGSALPAYAQATRTWVSGVGDDANPCSRTAPCKTFAGAISKTAAGGEINCLDPGGFGGVTITKAISIICDNTLGGILSAGAGVNGIVVNAPATSIVFLSGLDFNGAGSAQNGLRFIAGAGVHIQNSIIRNYRATNGLGISFQPSASSFLTVANSTIANNGTGATGGGILIQPTGAGGSARVTIYETEILSNASFGVSANSTGNTGPSTQVSITGSQLSGSTTGLNVLSPVGTTGITITLTDSVVFGNGTGIRSDGGTIQVAVGNTSLQANGTALVTANGGSVQSFGDNRLIGNSVVSNFNNPALIKQ